MYNHFYLIILFIIILIYFIEHMSKLKKYYSNNNIKIYNEKIFYDKFKKRSNDGVFMVGYSASGKTTFANKLSKLPNCKAISIDEIVREIAKKHKDSYKIFKIYETTGIYNNVENKVISIVRKKIFNFKKKRCIIEAVVYNNNLINKILSGFNFDIIFIQPASSKHYQRNLSNRFIIDVIYGLKRTNLVWVKLNKKENERLNLLSDNEKKYFGNKCKSNKINYDEDDYINIKKKILNKYVKNIIKKISNKRMNTNNLIKAYNKYEKINFNIVKTN